MSGFFVPTPEFIKNSYLKNQRAEIARLLSLEPVFDWDVITELDLSRLNIVHIGGLRLARNLKKLRMVQNCICKIENLHWLTRIEHLNLSYNKITRIENLQSLTAMRYLSLRHNGISVLENLDANTRLEEFYVSDNAIVDVDQVSYMQRFGRLRHMDVSNNPATRDGVRRLIVNRLPRLQYLDGVRITNRERPPARVSQLGEEEVEEEKDPEERQEAVGRPSDFLTDVDGPQFIYHLYRDDGAGRLLSKWNSTVRSAFGVYTQEVNDNAMEMYRTILNKLKVRDELSRTFTRNYHRLKMRWTESSRQMIREFDEIRKIRLNTLSNYSEMDRSRLSMSDSDVRSDVVERNSIDVVSCFESHIDDLVDKLLITNIKMNRSIVTIINIYENILQEEIKRFLDLLVPIFFNLREAENTYSQVLTENVKLVVNNVQKLIPKMFLNKFENRYAIVQAAYQITDKHLDMIYKREEKINADANNWTKNTIDELRNTEKKRFWMVIEEVVTYREKYMNWVQTLEY